MCFNQQQALLRTSLASALTRAGYSLSSSDLDRIVKLRLIGSKIWFVSLDEENFTETDSFYLSYFDLKAQDFRATPRCEGRMRHMIAEMAQLEDTRI